MTDFANFGSGSYLAHDVTVLLEVVKKDSIANVATEQKEALIQSGKRHYSEMLTLETAPTPEHLALYQTALADGKDRMALEIINLVATLTAIFKEGITTDQPLILVSLVRAGLPIGVLLQRVLTASDVPSRHFGMSILRGRGLDLVALKLILDHFPKSPIVFVDGWTGKGAIYDELAKSLAPFNDPNHANFSQIFHQGASVIPLLTLADPAGVAWLSASSDDWLIPSGLLNSTVSGLISRSLSAAEPSRPHRCMIYDNLKEDDVSLDFVDQIDAVRQTLTATTILPTFAKPRYVTKTIIDDLAKTFDINNQNRIKPTIAEATRAILRRDPERVLLAFADHPDTALLRHFCAARSIAIEVMGERLLPYQAVTLIKQRAP